MTDLFCFIRMLLDQQWPSLYIQWALLGPHFTWLLRNIRHCGEFPPSWNSHLPWLLFSCLPLLLFLLLWQLLLLRVFQLFLTWKMKVKSLSCVWLFATPWTIADHAPPSMGFSRQEYWSGLLFPSPGDLPNPGIESLMSPALAGGIVTTAPPRASLIAQLVKNLPAMQETQETQVWSLGGKDSQEEGLQPSPVSLPG